MFSLYLNIHTKVIGSFIGPVGEIGLIYVFLKLEKPNILHGNVFIKVYTNSTIKVIWFLQGFIKKFAHWTVKYWTQIQERQK